MKRRFALLSAGLMLGAAAGAEVMRPRKFMTDLLPKLDLEVAIPKQFADWRIDAAMPVVLPSPDVQAALDMVYNQVLSRVYVNREGRRIMLSVAYGGDQSDGTKIHRPENCYPGQGFAIKSNQLSAINLRDYQLPTRRLIATMGGRVEPISYWMMVGNEPSLSSTENKLAQLRMGLRGYVPDGLLMRISSIARETEPEFVLHGVFAVDLFGSLDPLVRPRIFGR